MRVYVPMWFQIKWHPTIKDAPINLWKSIWMSSFLEDVLRDIVDNVIQSNGYFAHPENILLAMLWDERRKMRELAVNRIISAKTHNTRELKKFEIPILNFSARDCVELIDWNNCIVTEPSLTKSMTGKNLPSFKREKRNPLLFKDVFDHPCHTQAV